ncbi:normocyte-binding protein [Fredinandcohnia quinoae]|uniref:Normocyte-binding protein n=1 Tax=Fredinandcohnia quinoae TaxID=2918902 RepID=A0AAW5E0Z2_9BACI|nr:normocyte-binding protein [Fredinandcohnia sp. SECRCQ15]MCH1625993.1 normocyte-binding protein [Fredinandcohnia sp. SECRCQ15]
MSLKDIVQDRINQMEDLEQRKQLKSIVSGLFTSLATYQEEMNARLEDRIFSEIVDSEEMHTIYVTICPRKDIDPIHDFLYPMLEEDLAVPVLHPKSINMALSEKRDIFLYTLFLACDYPMIQKLIANKPLFQGKMITNKGEYSIEVVLQQSQKYLLEIEKLYISFLKSALSWKTVNHPYANKFFDIHLRSMNGELQEGEVVQEISIHLQEWDAFKRTDIIPLWNIQRLNITTAGFPFPALDRVNYEHNLSIQKHGTGNGYLIDSEETNIRFMKRLPESLVVVSPVEESKQWNIIKITQPKEINETDYPYTLVSNKRKDRFLNRYANLQSRTIRTKGELFRMIDSFEAATSLKLIDLTVIEERERESNTYDMNPFVSENIRIDQNKKVLRITFDSELEDDYLIYDLISFLVSEIQSFFPEYRCEGVLK